MSPSAHNQDKQPQHLNHGTGVTQQVYIKNVASFLPLSAGESINGKSSE